MIDLWKMAGDIAKLPTYKSDDGKKLIDLEEVLAIIRKYIVENREVDDGK